LKKTIPLQTGKGSVLHILCFKDKTELSEYAKSINVELDYGEEKPDALFRKQGVDFYILLHNRTTAGDIGHETAHFINTLYYSINQKLDPINDEMYCYLLGYFVDVIIKFQQKANTMSE
jgi:hypothetical protein